nr:MAG TPA: hypothetical protein [Caudoviricetes sp.]
MVPFLKVVDGTRVRLTAVASCATAIIRPRLGPVNAKVARGQELRLWVSLLLVWCFELAQVFHPRF